MSILLYLTTIVSIYVATFKNDFKEEDLQKALPFIVILILFTIISALI